MNDRTITLLIKKNPTFKYRNNRVWSMQQNVLLDGHSLVHWKGTKDVMQY